MAGWLEESDFRSGCPLATTILETVPASTLITVSAEAILNLWTQIVAGVLKAAGEGEPAVTQKAEALIASVEGALILCRIRQSRTPLENIAVQFALSWAERRM